MLVSHRAFSTPMLRIQISWLVPSNPPIHPRFPCTKPSPFQSKGRWKSPGVQSDTINLSLQRFRYCSVEPRNWPPANLFEEDESVIGDCVVYEEGVFENPFVAANEQNSAEEDDDRDGLIPEDWLDLQRELNMTKKEKKKRMQMMELSNSFQKKKEFELFRDGLSNSNSIKLPKLTFLNSDSNSNLVGETERLSAAGSGRTVHVEDNIENELTLPDNDCSSDGQKRNSCIGDETASDSSSNKRFFPRNPRLEIFGAGFEDIAKSFDKGYRIKDSENMDGDRPEARRGLYSPEEKILLNKRVPDLQRATSAKWIPLHTLATAGQSYPLNLLLTYNVDINAVDKDGLTALHKAVFCKKQGIVNFLLKAGADASIRDRDGATLMHYAVEVAAVQIIKLLVLYGVDINLPDYYGWTPLHLAVQSRRTDVVRLLLIKGADKRIRNKDGNTPLDLCLYSGRNSRTYELIKLLKQLPKAKAQNVSHMHILM